MDNRAVPFVPIVAFGLMKFVENPLSNVSAENVAEFIVFLMGQWWSWPSTLKAIFPCSIGLIILSSVHARCLRIQNKYKLDRRPVPGIVYTVKLVAYLGAIVLVTTLGYCTDGLRGSFLIWAGASVLNETHARTAFWLGLLLIQEFASFYTAPPTVENRFCINSLCVYY